MVPKKEETSLEFLLKPIPKKHGWTDKRIRCLVRRRRAGQSAVKIAKYLKISGFTVNGMLAELKRAAKQHYTLEKYLREGRPCRTGRKILAK